jgi:hypothetical protein
VDSWWRYFAATVTSIVAVMDGARRIVIVCVPTVLTASISMRRRSTLKP